MLHTAIGLTISLVPSLSARQIFIAYSMKNRRGKSGSKRHDDACRNVTNLTSLISLAPVNFVPMHGTNSPKFKNCS